jgi:hypothetical protein
VAVPDLICAGLLNMAVGSRMDCINTSRSALGLSVVPRYVLTATNVGSPEEEIQRTLIRRYR